MDWVAISNRGISKPLFRPSKSETVNSDIYINECLEKRLRNFESPVSHKRFTRETIRRIESKMKEFEKFVESLLEGVKAKGKIYG